MKILVDNELLWGKFLFAILFTVVFSIIYMFFEDHEFIFRDEDRSDFDKIHNKYLRRLYFSIITQTTIGYGDVVPNSEKTRFIAGLQAFSTLLLIIIYAKDKISYYMFSK